MTKVTRIITGYLGAILFVPGFVKFFDPFKTFFTTQIDKAELPFPDLTFIAGQGGEITFGLLLLVLPYVWTKVSPTTADKLFYLGCLATTVIMVVAIYVHLHPAVPAEVLPFEKKPPILAVFTLVMVALDVFFYQKATAASNS